jgi:signal transduction histidine kinase
MSGGITTYGPARLSADASKRAQRSTSTAAAAVRVGGVVVALLYGSVLFLAPTLTSSDQDAHATAGLGVTVLVVASTLGLGLYLATARLVRTLGAERQRRRDAEASLALQEAALDQQQRERGERVHDARNMLVVLRTATDTLLKHGAELPAEAQRGLREAVHQELTQLEHLVNRAADAPARVPLRETLAPTVAAERVMGTHIELACDAEVEALCQRDDLVRAVQNVLANARRHAPGARVLVHAGAWEGEVRLYVEDDGPGVPEPLVDRLFERGSTGDPKSGQGLGLYVARELMRRQGGDLVLVPSAGHGARFLFTLPDGRGRC